MESTDRNQLRFRIFLKFFVAPEGGHGPFVESLPLLPASVRRSQCGCCLARLFLYLLPSNSREESRYVFDIRVDQAYFPPQSPGDVTSCSFFLAALGLWCSTWASVRGVQMLKHVGSGVAARGLSCPEARGISVCQPGTEPMSPALEAGFLVLDRQGSSMTSW